MPFAGLASAYQHTTHHPSKHLLLPMAIQGFMTYRNQSFQCPVSNIYISYT